MKKKMSKKEIAEAKRIAKGRENKRLSDGEHYRIMAQAMSGSTNDSLPVLAQPVKTTRESSQIIDREANKPHVKVLTQMMSDALTDVTVVKHDITPKGKNRRLTNKQYKSLMSKVADGLGINNNSYSLLDLHKAGRPLTTAQLMEQILFTLSHSQWDIYSIYQNIVKSKRIKVKDRLGLVAWLLYPNEVAKPMCLIPAKDKAKELRNDIIGLKKWGDVKITPVRVIPDDEYIREVKGKTRKKTDVFDRMPLDKKIEWARHAKKILGKETKEIFSATGHLKTQTLFNTNEMDLIHVAMKYACKMTGMRPFRGMYAEGYWVVYRINKYCEETTGKEFETFLAIAQEHMGWDRKKTIPLLSTKEFQEKLRGMLKHLGLEPEYKKWCAKNKDRVGFNGMATRKVKSLIQEYYRTH